jgi:hypothetical protein
MDWEKSYFQTLLLFHIYLVLKEVTGPVITLTWQEKCLRESSPVAINYSPLSTTTENNQNQITKVLTMNDSLNETIERNKEIGLKSNRLKKAISMKNTDILW